VLFRLGPQAESKRLCARESLERLAHLLQMLGERLELDSSPLAEVSAAGTPLTPRERLREAASWNLLAGKLEIAGAEARRAGHPATRVTPS
jgi:hypothetical protein